MNLSEHFTLEELTHSDVAVRNGWDNSADMNIIANLRRLAELLEMVRLAVGEKPIIINSGYRSKQVNDAIGSKDTSQHRLGCAADIRVIGMPPRLVVDTCIATQIPFDQIIYEFNSWTHISVTNSPTGIPRNQKLIIDNLGTRPYI